MSRVPRPGPGLLISVAAALCLTVVFAGVARPRLEAAVRERIEREAARRGLSAHVDTVHVGVFPPVHLGGVRLEKPGAWSLATDGVDVGLRPWGRGLVGRIRLALGRVTLAGPGGLTLEIQPTRWNVVKLASAGVGAELRAPGSGLAVKWLPAADGSRVEVDANEVSAGQILSLERGGAPLLDAGTLTGTLRLTTASGARDFDAAVSARGARLAALSNDLPAVPSEAAGFGQPTDVVLRFGGSWRPQQGTLAIPHWRVMTDGATVSGSLALSEVPRDPHLDLSLEVERVDFARLLQTSGLDQPEALVPATPSAPREGDLGSASLSVQANGRIADAASFVVSQRLDFTPPRRPLPALQKLRGEFVHEVVLPDGARRRIAVSPTSPDFIALAEVPALFLRTLLLAEDSGFYGHRGIDLSEVPAAILTNWARGGSARGASTITQQLAKNLFLSREKRLGRKLQELSLALLLESTLGKDRILEIYLNVIEWGPALYGLRPAARHYFHVEPAELTPRQIAFLVSIIPGPVKYQSSFASGTLSPRFRPLVDDLLAKVRSVSVLDDEEYQAALSEELQIANGPPEP